MAKNHIVQPIEEELEDPQTTLQTIRNFLDDFAELNRLGPVDKVNYLATPDALTNLSLNLTSCMYWLYIQSQIANSDEIYKLRAELRVVVRLAFTEILGLKNTILDKLVAEWFDLAKLEICLHLECLMEEPSPELVWAAMRSYFSIPPKLEINPSSVWSKINTWNFDREVN